MSTKEGHLVSVVNHHLTVTVGTGNGQIAEGLLQLLVELSEPVSGLLTLATLPAQRNLLEVTALPHAPCFF